MSADAVLRVDGVSLTFGGLVALDGVDLEVGAGTTHGIIGPNGAGKTTTFDVITGVYRPDSGSVVLAGTDVTGRSPHRRAWAGLARTFQTVGLAPGLTARDNVLATIEALERVRMPLVRPRTARRRAQEVDELLRYFRLDEYAEVQVTELPLGITKLLELAKVFAGEPKVVLLDEPFAGLSTGEARERVELLTARREDTGVGVVIVEHDVPLLLESCDRLTVLDAGRIVITGEPTTVMASPSVREAYMGEVVEDVEMEA
jgi:branched-chain amino acid transport system ATP-binding protein